MAQPFRVRAALCTAAVMFGFGALATADLPAWMLQFGVGQGSGSLPPILAKAPSGHGRPDRAGRSAERAQTGPQLPRRAATAEALVPAGWDVEQRAEGDLDDDGITDIALVLRERVQQQAGAAETHTGPRVLAVALGTPDGTYRIVAQDGRLIPPPIYRQFDPLPPGSGLKIEGNVLAVALEYLHSSAGMAIFRLQWQAGALRLVGFDFSDVHRSGGDIYLLSVNFLSRRVKVIAAHKEQEDERVRWSRLPPGRLPTLAEIGNGLDFDPDGLVSRLP